MVLLGLLAAMMLAASPVLAWQPGIACLLRDHTLWEQRISSASSSPGRASIPQWVRSFCRVNFLSFLSLFTNVLGLDFSDLGAKGVGYARHRSPLKEVNEMRTLPIQMIRLLAPFVPLFSKRVWQNAQVLLMGAILAPGARTVSSALRTMGLDQEKRFHRYHRLLSHARWSSLKASRVLLGLLVEMFVPEGDPLVVGIDETLERRWGKKIAAKGVYRDPVRSTHEEFVKSSGLRWVCVMLLVEIPWAARVWALPFLSALAPSERYAAKRGKRHKKITEWAWQLLLVLRRWYPQRKMVAVADRAYASLKLLDRCRKLSNPITFITRFLRLDAALYEPAPPRGPHQIGRPRLKGERLPKLSQVAQEPNTVRKPTKIAKWYGSGDRTVEIASQTAVWYSTGLFAVPIRWVLWCATPKDGSRRRPSCAPTSRPIRRRSSPGT